MLSEYWGLLGPDQVSSERRVRSLGVAPAIRAYNDAAVPGLGGLWFAKPLVIALAGIAVAEKTGQRPVVVANAVEALACWLALNQPGAKRDPRIRGSQKLDGKDFPEYRQASRPNFYVTQPMRQQTVQPLRALGLVESTSSDRFNAYRVSEAGDKLLSAAFAAIKPFNSDVLSILTQWVEGNPRNLTNSRQLVEALSPTTSLAQDARDLLREQLVAGDVKRIRRSAALAWVREAAQRHSSLSWDQRPASIDQTHWNDLRAGASFFAARDAALAALQEVECRITVTKSERVPLSDTWPALEDSVGNLRAAAQVFLDGPPDTSPEQMATAFCSDCTRVSQVEVLRRLVQRDERVLRMDGDRICKGPSFQPVEEKYGHVGQIDGTDDEPEVGDDIVWPPGISSRINNIHRLATDLDGKLGELLARAGAEA